jgi:ABC-type dipeptide/oligopeptide/nickel transport system permease subunit
MNNDVDGGLGRETPLAASFPLPFRALFLVGIGILGWATNLHITHSFDIDSTGVLDLAQDSGTRTPLPTDRRYPHRPTRDAYAAAAYTPVYRLFVSYAALCTFAWTLFSLITRGEVEAVDSHKYIPAVTCLGVLGMLLSPWDVFYPRERDAFLL